MYRTLRSSTFVKAKSNHSVRFVNLSQELIEHGLKSVLDEISRQVQASDAGIVVVDSFRTVLRSERHGDEEIEVQAFVQQLALLLTKFLSRCTHRRGKAASRQLHENTVEAVLDAHQGRDADRRLIPEHADFDLCAVLEQGRHRPYSLLDELDVPDRLTGNFQITLHFQLDGP